MSLRVVLKQCILTTRYSRVVLSVRALSNVPKFLKLQQQFPRGTRALSGLRPFVDNKLSYSFGRSTDNLEYSTIIQKFDRKLQECPDEVGYISHAENKEVSFRQLDHDINRLAKGMSKKLNILKGDFVGIYSYNCYNWLVAQLACARLGAVLNPINPSNKINELAFVLGKSKLKCLFLSGPKSVQVELNEHLQILKNALTQGGSFHLRNVVFIDDNDYKIAQLDKGSRVDDSLSLNDCLMHNWSSLMNNDGKIYKSVVEAEEDGVSETEACIISPDLVSPDDLFAVYYTSGTTGNPKGACVSHFTALNNARFCQKHVRGGKPDSWKSTICIVLPMFHIFAGVLVNFAPILSNARVIYAGYKYVVKDIVDAIIKHQANFMALTPTMLIDLLDYVESQKITDIPLKIVQSGGAYLSPETMSRTYKILPEIEKVRVGYGSTENGSIATIQNVYEPIETTAYSVGVPLDLTEIRIVKPDTNEVVPLGEKGEIQTRGFNTMLGYLDEPEKTANVLTESRWYKTGDMGFMYRHGSIQICGRLKHMIIKGGENIYPEEVSNLIRKLEYVADAHVVGVPDKRFGEQVCAWIKLRPGYKEVKDKKSEPSNNEVSAEDVIKFCKENITYFKVPKYVIFVDEFPLTPTKKVQSHLLTELGIKLLNLDKQTI